MHPILEVKKLNISVYSKGYVLHLVRDCSFKVFPGENLGIIGESGSGKSLIISALLGLLSPNYIVTGEISFKEKILDPSNTVEMAKLLGSQISFVMQDPSTALNPQIPIGIQLIEGLCYHKKMSKQEARQVGNTWLKKMGISEPALRMAQYPHEVSGGMKQRIMLAIALACQPQLLIADEPTTALDATVQISILNLLLKLQQEESLTILLVTHDMGVVAKCCQHVLVVQEGKMIESGPTEEVFEGAKHSYTQSLLNAFVKGNS